MRSTGFTPLVALAALLACQPAETEEQMQARLQAESDSARVAIEAANLAFTQHFNAGHMDSVGALYAPNAVVMAPGMPAVSGRDNIVATMRTMPAGMNLALETQQVTANGPMAVERGAWTMTVPGAEGAPPMVTRGKYLVHWHRIDGQWLLVDDIWNDDAPPPAMPATP
jgi:ketosteroid isomerase-like protein